MSGPCFGIACSMGKPCEKYDKPDSESKFKERCYFCGKSAMSTDLKILEDVYFYQTVFSTDMTTKMEVWVRVKDELFPCRGVPVNRGVMCKNCAARIAEAACTTASEIMLGRWRHDDKN
jgi:hypothetical protein